MPALSQPFDLPANAVTTVDTGWGQTMCPPFAIVSARIAAPMQSFDFLPSVRVESLAFDAASAHWHATLKNDGAALVGVKLALVP